METYENHQHVTDMLLPYQMHIRQGWVGSGQWINSRRAGRGLVRITSANNSEPIEIAEIEPTEIELTEIEITEIEPTEIEITEIEPTEIEPTKSTEIEPTEMNCY